MSPASAANVKENVYFHNKFQEIIQTEVELKAVKDRQNIEYGWVCGEAREKL